MNREEKGQIIESLKETIDQYNHFYITDTSGLNAAQTFALRKECYKRKIKMLVVKNTLLQKALESYKTTDYTEIIGTLKGVTAVMFCESGSIPGKMIQELRKKSPKPILKSAYVLESVFVGDDKLETLANLKSKEELIGDIIALLQSPVQRVLGALQSGGHTIAGVVKTLSERN
jgi:large subunit ribosomal protein L10